MLVANPDIMSGLRYSINTNVMDSFGQQRTRGQLTHQNVARHIRVITVRVSVLMI